MRPNEMVATVPESFLHKFFMDRIRNPIKARERLVPRQESGERRILPFSHARFFLSIFFFFFFFTIAPPYRWMVVSVYGGRIARG